MRSATQTDNERPASLRFLLVLVAIIAVIDVGLFFWLGSIATTKVDVMNPATILLSMLSQPFVRGALLFALSMSLLEPVIGSYMRGRRTKSKAMLNAAWGSDRDRLIYLRGLAPADFERYVAEFFSALGFESQVVGRSHDGGIDVRAFKDGVDHLIQCKRYLYPVPVSAIRDFYGVLAGQRTLNKGYFVTTSTFTLEAEKFADGKPIELIDGAKLIRLEKDLGLRKE